MIFKRNLLFKFFFLFIDSYGYYYVLKYMIEINIIFIYRLLDMFVWYLCICIFIVFNDGICRCSLRLVDWEMWFVLKISLFFL